MDMYRILESFDAVNSRATVSEAEVKRAMHADADKMSRAEFVDKYGAENGEYGMTPEEAAEFWNNVNGVEYSDKYSPRNGPDDNDNDYDYYNRLDSDQFDDEELDEERRSEADWDAAAISAGKRGRDARDNPSRHAARAKAGQAMRGNAKPDFLDLDRDGDKTEPMKGAAKGVAEAGKAPFPGTPEYELRFGKTDVGSAFDKKKISTGTVYSRKHFDEPEAGDDDAPRSAGRPKGTGRKLGAKGPSVASKLLKGKGGLKEYEMEHDHMNGLDRDEYDQEGEMARQDLHTMVDAARELHAILGSDENLPEWVQSKITKALDYIDTARDYMQSVDAERSDQPMAEIAPVIGAMAGRALAGAAGAGSVGQALGGLAGRAVAGAMNSGDDEVAEASPPDGFKPGDRVLYMNKFATIIAQDGDAYGIRIDGKPGTMMVPVSQIKKPSYDEGVSEADPLANRAEYAKQHQQGQVYKTHYPKGENPFHKAGMKDKRSTKMSAYDISNTGPKGQLPESDVAEADYSAKSARAGKDIGKPGKNFNKIAKGAAERYGSKAAGERVAGAVLNKLRHATKEGAGDLRSSVLSVIQHIYDGASAGEEMIDDVASELGQYFSQVKKSTDKTLRKAYQLMSREGAEAEDDPEYMAQVAKQAIDLLSQPPVEESGDKKDPPFAPDTKSSFKKSTNPNRTNTDPGKGWVPNPDNPGYYIHASDLPGKVSDPAKAKLGRLINQYFGQIYNYGDGDESLNYLDNNAPLWNSLFDKHYYDIDTIIANEPADVLKKAALELKNVADDLKYELDEQGVEEESSDKKDPPFTPDTKSSFKKSNNPNRTNRDSVKALAQKGLADMTTADLKAELKRRDKVDEESTQSKDQHAERAGKKVTKDIESDDKKDKKKEVEETTVSGSVAPAAGGDAPKKGKGGMQFGKGVYEGQLDELGKSTLGSYVKQAAKDVDTKSRETQQYKDMFAGDFPVRGAKKEVQKKQADIDKRVGGIGKAVDRLTKEGVYQGQVAESFEKQLKNVLNEGMTISVSKDDTGKKNITVSATDADAQALGDLLKMAGLFSSEGHGDTCPNCNGMHDADVCPGHAMEEDLSNSPDPVYADKDYMTHTLSGGLNGPKTTGQTTGAVVNRQDSRQGVMAEAGKVAQQAESRLWNLYRKI